MKYPALDIPRHLLHVARMRDFLDYVTRETADLSTALNTVENWKEALDFHPSSDPADYIRMIYNPPTFSVT